MNDAIATDPANSSLWFDLGQALSKTGDKKKAQEAFKRAIDLVPTLAEAWHELGLCYAGSEDFVFAEHALRESIRHNPSVLVPRISLGALLLAESRPADALGVFRDAAQMGQDSPAAWEGLGKAALSLGSREEAQRALERAVALDGGRAFAWFELSRLYDASGETARSRSALEAAVRADQSYLPAASELGRAWEGEGSFEKAIPLLKSVVDQRPDDGESWYLLGRCFYGTDCLDEAVDSMKCALKRGLPMEGEARALLARAHRRQKRKKALEAHGMAPALGALDADLSIRLVELLIAAGAHADALVVLDEILEDEPDNIALLRRAAEMQEEFGDDDEAAWRYERLLEHSPREGAAWMALGRLLAKRAQNAIESATGDAPAEDELTECARKAAELIPDNPEALLALAAVEAMLGNEASALGLARNVVHLAPDNSNAWDLLGLIQEHRGEADASVSLARGAALWQRATDDNPYVVLALTGSATEQACSLPPWVLLPGLRGLAFLRLGDWQAAADSISIAISPDPPILKELLPRDSLVTLWRGLATARSRLGDMTGATLALQHVAQSLLPDDKGAWLAAAEAYALQPERGGDALITFLASACESHPEDRGLWVRYIQALRLGGRCAEVSTRSREALARYPDDPELVSEIALAAAEAGEVDRARSPYRHLGRISPDAARLVLQEAWRVLLP